MRTTRGTFGILFLVLLAAPHENAQPIKLYSDTRAKPLQQTDGQRTVAPGSPKNGPVERDFIGGWQQSPFPSCPLGTYATTTNLSPDGCLPCPRGTIATSMNLASKEECHMCPPGQYNDKKGRFVDPSATSSSNIGEVVVQCTPCPANTFGADVGLETRDCTGRCPKGFYTRGETGKTRVSDCVACPPNYNGGGGQCIALKATLQRLQEQKTQAAADAAAQALPPGQRATSPEYIRLMSQSEYHSSLARRRTSAIKAGGYNADIQTGAGVGLQW